MDEIHYNSQKWRMKTQMELLFDYKNITIHNEFIHMVANLNYTAHTCGNISNHCSWP
jgi:hypothetical protein